MNSIEDGGQIQLEKSKTLSSMYYNFYSFTPNKIKIKIKDNSDNDNKISIIKGISEENCNQMFVSFEPQTNFKGNIYRSSCENEQLIVSIQSNSNSSSKRKLFDDINIKSM